MQFRKMLPSVERIFFILSWIFLIQGKEVIWKFDTDISNPENWVGGKLGVDCKGLHFAEYNSAPVKIKRLITAQIVLGKDGVVELDNALVEFSDNKKCIQLKSLNYHNWYDPTSWRLPHQNSAIPDKEKVPCKTDQITIPNFEHTAISGLENKELLVSYNSSNLLNFNKAPECRDPYGCLCHEEFITCPNLDPQELQCSNPVYPEESCHEICGAYITYKPGEGPTLREVQERLLHVQSDSYVSRVKDYLGDDLLQVVLSERDFTGISLEEADGILRFLQDGNARNVQIFRSGQVEMKGSNFGVIFGSFVGVVFFFAVVFYLNGEAPIGEVFSRWNRRQGSVFSIPFFARFDNTDENLIIEGSESGSIMDIAKSFDNPMYEHGASSSENPLYKTTTNEDIEE